MYTITNRFVVIVYLEYSKKRASRFISYHHYPSELTDPLYYNPHMTENNVKDMLEEQLEERCIIESGFCRSELDYMQRHLEEDDHFELVRKFMEIDITVDPISLEWIKFIITDPLRHNTIGVDSLYDDSEYPNDF